MAARQQKDGRAIIVHWAFRHRKPRTLPRPAEPRGLEALPDALIREVAQSLKDARDLVNFQMASQCCRQVASDDILWKRLCRDKFGVPSTAKCPSWRDLYKFNHRLLHDIVMSKNLGKPLSLGNGNDFLFIQIP
ncbi:hypothetical protein BSKO_11419 [Bryopsis sp. KO-2023]|nr:hypothetical protein BSKO_11419 [Bryopsis sp. KO-2023]